jgi:hypothetical protein
MCSGCGIARPHAVIQPHRALDHADVGTGCRFSKRLADALLSHHERVQIPGRASAYRGVVARIDVIGSDLKRRNRISTRKRSHQRHRDGGFANATVSPCYQYCWHGFSDCLVKKEACVCEIHIFDAIVHGWWQVTYKFWMI